jgi:hypothetical protein
MGKCPQASLENIFFMQKIPKSGALPTAFALP